MADINVERKGPSVWPWIAGLLVLAIAIWALAEMFGGDAVAVDDADGDTTTIVAPGSQTPVVPSDTQVVAP